MKYQNFKQKVESLGLSVKEGEASIFVKQSSLVLAVISTKKVNDFSVSFFYDTPHALMNLITEFTKTPIEDRKEKLITKYKLILPFLRGTETYLNKNRQTEEYFLASEAQVGKYQTMFTLAEILKMSGTMNLGSFEQIEVVE